MAATLVQIWPKEYVYRDVLHTSPSDLRDISTIDTAVIHHSACCGGTVVSGSLQEVLDGFSENHRDRIWSKKNAYGNYITYHDVIDYEWNIIHTSPWNELRRHAGHFPTNTSGLWRCYIWNWSSVEPSTAQYEAIGFLYTQAQEKIWDIKLWQHKDYKATSCPWVLFDISKVLNHKQTKNISPNKEDSYYRSIYISEWHQYNTIKNPEEFVTRWLENIKKDDRKTLLRDIAYYVAVWVER